MSGTPISTITQDSKKYGRRRPSIVDRRILTVSAVLLCLVALPFFALLFLSFEMLDIKLWSHLTRTVLWSAVSSTFILLVGVGVLVTLIGVATAWLVTICRFRGSGVFSVLLLLPLALPTYVSAFAYIEFLGFTGPVQTLIRDLFDYSSVRQYWFPDYRTTGGAIVVMSLVLYPYVYLTSRAAFAMQTASAFDACRTLGVSSFALFWRVALPMARPAIIVGVALALMETANDIGAVEFFGVRTLTTTIYDVWLNRSSLSTAAQIACLFLLVVALLLWFERRARRAQKLYQTSAKITPFQPFYLSGWKAFAAFSACTFPVLFGFIIPVLVLLESAIDYVWIEGFSTLWEPSVNTIYLAIAATLVTMGVGFFFAYITNIMPHTRSNMLVRLTTLGYAVPGVVLAVGILIPLAALDNTVDALMREFFNLNTGLLLSGTTVALIYAYSIRFLPISFGSSDTGFQRLSPNYGHAARTLGRGELAVLCQVHLPLLRWSVMTGGILVFVDCMKELPATLLLRPFNYNTLATRIYDAASLEVFEEGALPALAIVAVGLLPVILLSLQKKP